MLNIMEMTKIMNMAKKSQNPMKFVADALRPQAGDNQMLNNVLDMLEKGDTKGVEQSGRNLTQSKGFEANPIFQMFGKSLGMF